MILSSNRLAAIVVIAPLALTSMMAGDVRRPISRVPPDPSKIDDGARVGLVFRLGEDSEGVEKAPQISRPPATALDPAAAAKVLDRLPPLTEAPSDRTPFAVREKSLPPPRAGKTVAVPFPPPAAAPTPAPQASGPLSVVRHAPDGEVNVAADLSVTFSQPMVAVTSHDTLRFQDVPVRVTPQPAGGWRWVGTKTLLFDPDVRFPMATRHEVEVPAGTRSAAGGVLAAPVRWTFTTPPPSLTGRFPDGTVTAQEPLILAAFDQKIDPAAMLSSIRVAPSGGAPATLRLASGAEIEADTSFREAYEAAPKDRRVAFRPEQPLPSGSRIEVRVLAGAPSAEGPIRTTKEQSWTFDTYGPMRITEHRCGWDKDCPPGTPWNITFSNPIAAKKLDRTRIRVSPEVRRLKITAHGNVLNLQPESKARTAYTVTIDAGLPDTFGQRLETTERVTFHVGAAQPAFFVPGEGLAVLDPAGPPAISAFTAGYRHLHVKAFAVTPEDFPRFQKAAADAMRGVDGPPLAVGRPVMDERVVISGAPDDIAETALDLRSALGGKPGHLVVVIRPEPQRKESRGRDEKYLWVQSTRIGLDAFVDREELVAWATSLVDGKPLAGATLSVSPEGTSKTLDTEGLARFPLGERGARLLIARAGDDVAFLPENISWWSEGQGWKRRPSRNGVRVFVFDDRHLYRPDEEAKLKGWIRHYGEGRGGDIGLSDIKAVKFVLRDSQGNEITSGERPVGRLGGFDLSLKLPKTMNLGPAHLELGTAAGPVGGHSFDVQEFRRPEFEVKVTPSEGPYIVGTKARATVAASYYAGGPLGDSEVQWLVRSVPGSFRPPNWDDYVFGSFVPWWRGSIIPPRERGRPPVSFAARTSAAGKHVLRIDLDSVTPPQPSVLTATATVMDVNRQAWSDTTSLVVHPASVYVGLRSERNFVERDQPLHVDVIVPDLDGKAITGRPVAVRSERLDWEQVGDEYEEVVASTETCDITSASSALRCTFRPTEGGTYRITATVRDDAGRPNETSIRLWVAGGKTRPRRALTQEEVELVPSKKEFHAGDTAEILVIAPFAPAEGLLTLRRSGLVRTERFSVSGSSHTLQVPIDGVLTPNVHVQVDLVGAAAKRPAFARGAIDLPVSTRERALAVTAKPKDALSEPGASTSVDVEVKDASGKPVAGGEVALVVVDEAVLALSGYKTPNPLATFYAPRDAGVSDYHSRSHVVLAAAAVPPPGVVGGVVGGVAETARADAMMSAAPAPPAPMARSKAAFAADEAAAPIRLRTDMSALALFSPSVTTDGAGRASVSLKLPDNLTRYRIMAVAAAGEKSFGSGESTLTARLPLMVRPSPPRFLNWGDRFEMPVVIQNQTGAPLDVSVALRASNLKVVGAAGRRLTVGANDRAEVRFEVESIGAGTARVQVGGAAGAHADAASVSLPVWSPATTEAFATYGEVDDGVIRQRVETPAGVVPQFGGLEVTTSSTALQALTDAVLYLVSYRFDCTEQIASRVMGIAALKDVLAAFEAKDLPKPEVLVETVNRDLARLAQLQNNDGGFAFWRRGDPSWPYLSIHVAHAFQVAKAKGFDVPARVVERSQRYLERIEANIPKDYPPAVRHTLSAYALYVRNLAGSGDAVQARRLTDGVGVNVLSIDALGWLLGSFGNGPGSAPAAAAIRRHLDNRVSETASTAQFATSYEDGAHLLLHSSRRTDAIVLDALIATDPKSDLVPKLVAGLLNGRKGGRWLNTQENVFVLLALNRYFTTYEKVAPDFVARLWLGDRYAGEQAFKGRSTDRRLVEIPMSLLTSGARAQDLVLAKEGTGRLYYRIGLRYAPEGLRLDAADHGFTVERTYLPVDDPSDVRRDPDGTWHVRAGATVRVRLTMVAPARRYHVALVDPLPGGFEALNPSLATAAPVNPEAQGDGGGRPLARRGFRWPRPWFDHQNLRDERAEAFAAQLWEGVHPYSYVARATTPGLFVVPPTTAEEMYQPETFGRGPADRVVIE